MFLTDFSIKRPIAMSCLIIGLSLLGFKAYKEMGIELMPQMDIPFITISTVYPGASPEQIETDVAKRIEDKVVTIDGLKNVSSSCMENVCITLLEFNMGVDVDIAATDVREKLDLIKSDFPEDVEDPKILKFDINAKPIINLALTGNVGIDELYDYADNDLRDKLTVISGVADVELVGGAKREVHVILDRDKLAEKGLSSLNVLTAVRQGIKLIPSGRIQEKGTEYSVKFDADYYKMADIASLQIAGENGSRCYIRDVGRVEMTTEELRQKAFIDGKDCVYIKVVKKSEANAVKVVSKVKNALAKLNKQLPGGMELIWVSDDGAFIEATVSIAWENVFEGILLTAVILFLFLYNVRSTFIIAITMPTTIIIGLFFMQFFNYTLNTSTLIAIGLSVGILVTNSIVVMEAIVDRLNRDKDPKSASSLASNEVFIAVFASAATNIVVLFPIVMMGGKIGQFMKPLAGTMLIMTFVSLFISFSLTPMLCSIILKPKKEGRQSILTKMEDKFNLMLNKTIAFYRILLEYNEKNRKVAILFVVAVAIMFIHSLSLGKKVGFGFFQDSDHGQVFVKLEYPTRYDINLTTQRVKEVQERLKDLPELKHILASIGRVEGVIGQASEGVYLSQILLKFSERTERKLNIEQLMQLIRDRLTDYPGCIVTVSQPTVIGGQSQDIELEISGPKLDILDELAMKTKAMAHADEGFTDADTTVRQGKPEIRIYPNRAVLADLGFGATTLGQALRANIEGIDAGIFKANARNYDIVVLFDKKQGKSQIEQFMFPGGEGKPILLTTLGNVEEKLAPIQITRKNKMRISKVLANISGSKPLGNAVNELGAEIQNKGNYPPGYDYKFAGTVEVMGEAQNEFKSAGIIAVMLVILTLAALLESFKQPWLVLITLPLALIGVMWALALTGESMSMFVLLGIVMMIGIVVNAAILIMDKLNVHIKEGTPVHKAMISAACEEFRPVAMIILAAVLGMLPMAISSGIGAEMRTGVGIAAVGGILISGILTLIIMPILYDLFTRKRKQ